MGFAVCTKWTGIENNWQLTEELREQNNEEVEMASNVDAIVHLSTAASSNMPFDER